MKTVLDLHLSAAAAALSNLDEMSRMTLHQKTVELCLKDGFSEEDYGMWYEVFVERRHYYIGLKSQRLPSEVAKAPIKTSPVAGQPSLPQAAPVTQTANPE